VAVVVSVVAADVTATNRFTLVIPRPQGLGITFCRLLLMCVVT
jgi:hypothetical protein